MGLLALNAGLLGAPAAAAAHFSFGLSLALSILAGAPFAIGVVALILWKDNRPMPEGALRLSPGKLSYSGSPGVPIEIAVSEIRDLVDDHLSRAILIRQKTGPRIAIPLARLDVSARDLKEAFVAWISTSGSEVIAAFTAEAIRAKRRRTLLRWAIIVGVAIGLVRTLVLLMGE